MKTSNKLLIGTGICIILGIFSYAFVMRGAYQKALANPLSRTVKVDFKGMKYLNISQHWDIHFKYGSKFEVEILREYKDSLNLIYKGDTLMLKAKNTTGDLTIYLPNLPILTFNNFEENDTSEKEVIVYGEDENYPNVYFDSTLNSGQIQATFLNHALVHLYKCKVNNVDISTKKGGAVSIEKSEIKNLKLNLANFSSLSMGYSNIQSKNIVLGDSCSVNISGKQSQIDFLK
jgi:hypothetical protein